MSNNPYQAPSAFTGAPTAKLIEEIKPPNIGLVALKWLVICVVSAAPSFFWGLAIGGQQSIAATGMILGVLTFALAYTIFECTPFAQRLLRDRLIKRTAKIGYGTRLGISIIFPVGLYLDMVVGLAAIGTLQSISGENTLFSGGVGGEGPPNSVLWFFTTTVVQGIYLNIILLVYMLFVYALVRLFSRPKI